MTKKKFTGRVSSFYQELRTRRGSLPGNDPRDGTLRRAHPQEADEGGTLKPALGTEAIGGHSIPGDMTPRRTQHPGGINMPEVTALR